MHITRRGLVSGGIAIGLTAGLAGCANPLESLIQKGVEKGIEKGTGGKVDVDTGGGASLPDGWPDIPVPPGKPSLSVKNEDGMMVTFQTDQAAVDKVLSDFEGKGFTKGDSEMDMGEMKMVTFENAEWTVNLQIVPADDKTMLNYVVTPKSK